MRVRVLCVLTGAGGFQRADGKLNFPILRKEKSGYLRSFVFYWVTPWEILKNEPSDRSVFSHLETVDDPPKQKQKKQQENGKEKKKVFKCTYRLTYEPFTVPSPIRYYIYLYKLLQWSVLAGNALFPVLAASLSSKLLKFACTEPATLRLDTLVAYRNKTNIHLK